MSLKEELSAFRAEFMHKVPVEIRAAMARADLALAVSGITERALKAGATAPDIDYRNRLEPNDVITALRSRQLATPMGAAA